MKVKNVICLLASGFLVNGGFAKTFNSSLSNNDQYNMGIESVVTNFNNSQVLLKFLVNSLNDKEQRRALIELIKKDQNETITNSELKRLKDIIDEAQDDSIKVSKHIL